MYRSTFLTSALVGGEWSAFRPERFTPRKEPPVPTGWAPESVRNLWRREKSCTTGTRTRAVQLYRLSYPFNGNGLDFYLGLYLVRFSAGTPDTMIEIYRGSPQSLYAITKVLPPFRHYLVLPNPFQLILRYSSYHLAL
jgi:hypothetical protein